MREMKDSGIEWIGKIPASWDISPIKYNYEIVAGATPDSSIAENWDGDIAWITPADYKTNDVYIFKGKRTISNRGYKSCATSLLPIGSIIFSKRAPIGSVAISATSLCTNQGCLGLIKKNGAANNKFFYYVLSIYSDVFNLFGSGTTFKEISTNTFANIALPYPQVSTQERIASFLDSKCSELNSLSADIQKEIETLEQYKRSVITEAVTKGLNPDVEMKDSGVPWIGKMPANWTCIKGKYILKYMQKPVKTDDGVITCFRDGEVTLRSNRREDGFTMADKEIGYQGIDVGDLVVHGMDGFAGAIGISDSRGKASPVLNVLNSRQNKKYIMYYLRSMAYGDVFAALATGIRVRSCDLRWNKLSVLLYPVPPLEEQAGIVQYIEDTLNKVNGVISEKKQQLTVIDSYKKSLIYEYVTGKKGGFMMEDFEGQLDKLLSRAKEIRGPVDMTNLSSISYYEREANIWINNVEIFYNKYLKSHALGDRIKSILFHRNGKAFGDLVACLESIKGDREFIDKMNGIQSVNVPKYQARTLPEYDVFISHANKDKEDLVEELYQSLKALGISIFYDKESLEWGDKWKDKILDGTKKAEFAIIVISENFFDREWTEKELNEFLNRQNRNGQKLILPILHNITAEQLKEKYPSVADIQGVPSDKYSCDQIALLFAKQLIKRLKSA